jgi:hypothetical protein
MSLAEIKRRVRLGQIYDVTNHQADPVYGTVRAVVTRTADNRFYLAHALGEAKIYWPPARHVSLDADGTLHLRATGEDAGKPHLTLVPVTDAPVNRVLCAGA